MKSLQREIQDKKLEKERIIQENYEQHMNALLIQIVHVENV